MPKAVPSRSRRIARPPPAGDRVQPLRLSLIALVCFALGVGAVVGNAGGKRIVEHELGRSAPRAEPASTAETRDVAAADTAAPGDLSPPAFVVAEGDAGAALVAAAQALDAGPPIPSATPFVGARRIEPGRVAYLRCEGVPQRPGPYPCPRDEALEAAVWAVLDTLPRCADAPPGLGESDVRLELTVGAPTDVKLRAPRPGVPRLDGPAILRCAAGPLSHIATTTRATELVLSFRFALVDASLPRTPAAPQRGTPAVHGTP